MDNNGKISHSFISSDIVINGNLTSTGRILISGQINGNVSARNLGVEASGRIKGNIKADDTELMGWQKGNISSKKLSVISGSKFRGNISCDNLIVEHGADIAGKIKTNSK